MSDIPQSPILSKESNEVNFLAPQAGKIPIGKEELAILMDSISKLSQMPKEERKKLMNNAKSKRYYERNKEKLREKHLSYYHEHKDQMNNYIKEYREKNKVEILNKKKVYYNEHKEELNKKISEKNKERIMCTICFKEICRASLKRHMSSTHPDDVLRGFL
jgi:DNA polymerase III delta prime subunit